MFTKNVKIKIVKRRFSMTKTASNISKIIAFICALLCCALILSACGTPKYKIDVQIIGGEGGVVTGAGEYEEGDEVTLTATPNANYTFVGWFNSQTATTALSNATTYTFEATNDATYYAKFAVPASNYINRLLNGAYNTYSTMVDGQEQYSAFNVGATLDLDVEPVDGTKTDVTVNVQGALDLQGYGTKALIQIKNNTLNANIFELYYEDSQTNPTLYVGVGADKYAFNFISLSTYVSSLQLPTVGDSAWNLNAILESLVGANPEISAVINSVLGIENSFGLFGDVEWAENSASLEINVDTLLTLLANVNFEQLLQAPILDQILDALTSANDFLPLMTLTLSVDFETVNGVEYLSDVTLNFDVNDDYNIELGDIISNVVTLPDGTSTQITIPASNTNIAISNLNVGFDANLAEVAFDKTQYPQTNANLLNMQVGADFNIYSGANGETLDRAYRLEVNTDINPFALLPAVATGTFDYNLINWGELGFISVRIYDPTGEQNDYLNILYDSQNSTQIYVYANFVNPIEIWNYGENVESQVQYTFNLNTSFEISEFVAWIQNFVQNIQSLTSSTEATQAVSNVAGLNLDVNNIFVELIKGLTSDTSIIQTALNYDSTKGITLDVTNLDLTLEIDAVKWRIDLVRTLFGDDATMVALKFDSFQFGVVSERNSDNEMINPNTNESFIDELLLDSSEKWADEGDQIVEKVVGSAELDGITSSLADLETTINNIKLNLFASTGVYSAEVQMLDGTERSINMGVLDAIVENVDADNNTATIKFVLTNLDQSSIGASYYAFRYFVSLAAGMGIPDISLPYGLYTYTTTITLTE